MPSANSLEEEEPPLHDWHAIEAEEVFQVLQTRVGGLTEDEATNRWEKFGPNELLEEKRTTPLNIFLNQFKSILIIILVISALVSGFIAWLTPTNDCHSNSMD